MQPHALCRRRRRQLWSLVEISHWNAAGCATYAHTYTHTHTHTHTYTYTYTYTHTYTHTCTASTCVP